MIYINYKEEEKNTKTTYCLKRSKKRASFAKKYVIYFLFVFKILDIIKKAHKSLKKCSIRNGGVYYGWKTS
jgi:hypothetical protein